MSSEQATSNVKNIEPLGELPQATFTTSTSSSINKRKYEDALNLLDEAAGTRVIPAADRLPPPKRPRTSLYSTLAKYGIGTSVDHGHNSSINNLRKAIVRAKAPASGKGVPLALENESEGKLSSYDPASRDAFLARLQTFKLATYSSKPPELDSVAAARCGWFNEGGKEVLTCKTCNATWTMPPLQTTTKEELNIIIAKQKAMLVDQHQNSCPWRVRQSEASIYSMPIPSPSVLSSTILERARQLEPLLTHTGIKHPLTAHQVSILSSAVSFTQSEASRKAADRGETVEEVTPLSETPIIVAFFGWEHLRPRAMSTPSMPGTSRPASPSANGAASTPITSRAMVTCQLCQRQVGLWTFTSAVSGSSTPSAPTLARTSASRSFDVLKEHRPHCPFIAKTTYLPTVNLPQRDMSPIGGTISTVGSSISQDLLRPLPFVEGWKALMSVISRSQWRRTAVNDLVRSSVSTPASEIGSPLEAANDDKEVDEVKEIVKDVKSRHGGGRELVKFIKGLLG